jgi:hypothetical protein
VRDVFKRVIWWGTGAAMGAVGSAYAQHKVKKTVRAKVARYTPPAVADRVLDRAKMLGSDLRSVVDEGKAAQADRESELRSRFRVPRR